MKHHWIGDATTEYIINDFQINDLPEDNPLQQIIDDFVQRRTAFFSKKNNSGTSNCRVTHKPKLDEFWKRFEAAVLELNTTYKSSKQQFENDMKAYKDCGNYREDDDLWAQ